MNTIIYKSADYIIKPDVYTVREFLIKKNFKNK